MIVFRYEKCYFTHERISEVNDPKIILNISFVNIVGQYC